MAKGLKPVLCERLKVYERVTKCTELQSESILSTRHCYTVVSLCLYGWLFGWQINDNLECRLYFCLTADDPGGVLLLLCWNGPLHLLLPIWPHRAGLLILLPPGVGIT